MTDERSKPGPRDIILARRALYLTTALATIGCSSKTSVPTSAGSSGGGVGSGGNPPPATASASAEHVAVAPKASFKEVMDKRPPLDVPEGLSGQEALQLKGLRRQLEERYRRVGVVWRQVPACDPAAPECEPEWSKLGDDARAMYRSLDGASISPCSGVFGQTASYRLRGQAHNRYLLSLTKRIEAHLSEVAKGYSYGSERRWQLLLAKAKQKPPMPCLSPCRMPEVTDIFEHVPFEKGSAELQLDGAAKAALQRVLQAQRSFGTRAKLQVRGHADAAEKDPQGLADKRAKAVVKWLADNGIPGAQLASASLGAKLMVERSGGQQAAGNRRVDFFVTATEKSR